MPANISTIQLTQSDSQLHNDFYGNHCVDCPLNTLLYYVENHRDCLDDDYCVMNHNTLYANSCAVYYRGFQGQPCTKGYEFKTDIDPTINVQNMVFQINLSYLGNRPRFQKSSDNAHLCAGYVDEKTTKIYKTREYSAPNVYSGPNSNYYNGNICWGSTGLRNGEQVYQNFMPNSLRNMATMFFQSGTNNDLLPIRRFKQYNEELSDLKEDNKNYHESHFDKFLCSGYDSLMLIDADADVQTFFTMVMAGFKPIPEAPHIMMIPLKNCTIERDGNFYFGYSTQEDSVGRCWYVSSEGYMIGQLDESYAYV
jgi:hypothetical protein